MVLIQRIVGTLKSEVHSGKVRMFVALEGLDEDGKALEAQLFTTGRVIIDAFDSTGFPEENLVGNVCLVNESSLECVTDRAITTFEVSSVSSEQTVETEAATVPMIELSRIIVDWSDEHHTNVLFSEAERGVLVNERVRAFGMILDRASWSKALGVMTYGDFPATAPPLLIVAYNELDTTERNDLQWRVGDIEGEPFMWCGIA